MTATCSRAVRSLRVLVALNLRQALNAKRQKRPRLREHHLRAALLFRSDAMALTATSAS